MMNLKYLAVSFLVFIEATPCRHSWQQNSKANKFKLKKTKSQPRGAHENDAKRAFIN